MALTPDQITSIIVAIIGLSGVVITAWFGYKSTRRERLRSEQAEAEIDLSRSALDFGEFMGEWDGTVREIERLFEDTNIDRFMLFRAWNGSRAPRWTTAVIQIRKGSQRPVSYVHFELDPHYVDLLREVAARHHTVLNVSTMAEGALKRVYKAENVTASFIAHLNTRQRNATSHAVTYCSFATHTGAISETTATRCAIISGRLKGVAGNFYEDCVPKH